MRLTLSHNRRVVADVHVRKDNISNAIRAASGDDLDALATVSTPWGDRPAQGRPVTKHRDGSTSLPIHNQHVKIDVSVIVVDEDDEDDSSSPLSPLSEEICRLQRAVREHGERVRAIEQILEEQG